MTSAIDLPYQVVISSDDSQIAFDAVANEQHERNLTITEHPVEEGAKVTDHAQKEPDQLTLNGIISDHPILLNRADLEPVIPGGDPENRAQQALDEFERLQETASLLTVDTEKKRYENMMIVGISVTMDAPRRYILDIGLSLKEFRKATVESVEAPEPIEPVHKDRRRGGPKNTKPPASEVAEKSETSLEAAANALDRLRGGI